MARGSLIVVGSGIQAESQLTDEANYYIRKADIFNRLYPASNNWLINVFDKLHSGGL